MSGSMPSSLPKPPPLTPLLSIPTLLLPKLIPPVRLEKKIVNWHDETRSMAVTFASLTKRLKLDPIQTRSQSSLIKVGQLVCYMKA